MWPSRSTRRSPAAARVAPDEARAIADAANVQFQFVQGLEQGDTARYATADGSVAAINLETGQLRLSLNAAVFDAPSSTWSDLVAAPLAAAWRHHGFYPLHAAAVSFDDGCAPAPSSAPPAPARPPCRWRCCSAAPRGARTTRCCCTRQPPPSWPPACMRIRTSHRRRLRPTARWSSQWPARPSTTRTTSARACSLRCLARSTCRRSCRPPCSFRGRCPGPCQLSGASTTWMP